MKSGDVMLKFGDEEIDDTRELVRIVADTPVGQTVDVVVFRDGEETTLKVEVGLLEDDDAGRRARRRRPTRRRRDEESVLGMTVAAVTDELRQQLRARQATSTGLVVTAIDAGSDAFAKGMREGDVIAEVGQEAVATPEGDAGAASTPPRRPGATRSCSSSAATASPASWR